MYKYLYPACSHLPELDKNASNNSITSLAFSRVASAIGLLPALLGGLLGSAPPLVYTYINLL